MPCLVQLDRNKPAQRFPLQKTETRIGRRPDNDIPISNIMISGHHAHLIQSGTMFTIKDLNSTNGTFVNGKRISDCVELSHYDQISLGGVEFIFLVDDDATVKVPDRPPTSPETPAFQLKKDASVITKKVTTDQLLEYFQSVRTMILNESTDKAALVLRFTELERMFHLLGDQLKETERFQQRLHTLYEVGKIINLLLEEDELLQTIIDLALKVMKADCGFIMLYDDEQNLVPRIARKMEADEFSSATSTFSTTIANQVASSGKSILTSDAQSDERFQTGASIISHHIRSVICAPLRNKDQKTIGVLYVGSNVLTNIFSSNDVELLEAFANHAAISIENAKLYEERRRREHLKSALERYVSKQIAERIISNDATGNIRFVPEKREVTVVFSDIRGFTTLAERLSPEDMVEILNRYFTKMIDVIFRYGGTLDKFMGDSIMALFGAPESTGQDAIHAVQAAVEMQNTARQFNEEQAALGKPQITVGIGINTGPVVVGNIGSDQRMEYSAIGDDVNLASRLQGIARGWQILISKATYDKVKKHVNTNRLEPITVKGKTKPVEIYEIVYESPVS